jgi:ABC-type dipeptide/oligopeptide/nickel transport system permease component
MLAYITRRFLLLILVLFGVSVLLFGIFMTFSPERRAAAYVTSPQQAKDIPRRKKYPRATWAGPLWLPGRWAKPSGIIFRSHWR